MSEDRSGFIIHVYHKFSREAPVVYAMGKLDNGQTFGIVDYRMRPFFYIRRADLEGARGVLDHDGITYDPCVMVTMADEPVLKVHGTDTRTLRNLADELESRDIRTFEADIPLTRRYRIERRITGPVSLEGEWRAGDTVDWIVINPTIRPEDTEPELTVISIDIETDPDVTTITAVSLAGDQHEEVHVVGEPTPADPDHLQCHKSETAMLHTFAERVRAIDPDIITGWNVIDFDIKVIEERCKALEVPFLLGRSRDACRYQPGTVWGNGRAIVPGRQVLDALHLVRHSLKQFDDMRLGTVAREILGRGKLFAEHDDESMPEVIDRAYREDRTGFAEYCLEDARLAREILEAENLVGLTLRRSILTGLPLDRAWGSVAAFEFLYITELHRRNIVAPTTRNEEQPGDAAPGGWVLTPDAGLHRDIAVFDFLSLYPSIIRTFNIDPLAHARVKKGQADETIEAPNGARFDRQRGVLPEMLDVFFDRRREAKAAGDDLASYTYKIVMNSFYGVLGTPSCRFASPQLAAAITRFGHYLLQWSKDLIESRGHKVLYGDTDSLFVELTMDDGDVDTGARELCAFVNDALRKHTRDEFGVTSMLEIEYEKLFHHFLLPPLRGQSTKGRAKGYAGMRRTDDGNAIDIVGMEAVRRDWTDMAHELQRRFIDHLFNDSCREKIENFVHAWISDLKAGKMDDKLVYRRTLRKKPEHYTKTTPPHFKAAQIIGKTSGIIYYVITVHGPQPLSKITSPLDYDHYISKQVEPIITALGSFCDLDVHGVLTGEQLLF